MSVRAQFGACRAGVGATRLYSLKAALLRAAKLTEPREVRVSARTGHDPSRGGRPAGAAVEVRSNPAVCIGPLRALFQDPPSGRGARRAGLPKFFCLKKESKNFG